MKTKKPHLLLAAALSVTTFMAQAQVEVQAPITTSLPPGSPERLRVSNGFLTHLENGAVGSFGTGDQWQSIGRVNGAAQTLYGYRVQRAGRALLLGFDGPLQTGGTPTLAEAFIQWGGNDPAGVKPGDLLVRNFTSPFSASPVLRFRFTGDGNSYSENGRLGHRLSGGFGDLSGSSQWISHGELYTGPTISPLNYGTQIQNGAQGLRLFLNGAKAIAAWGDQGNDMVFRYLTNRNTGAGFDILTLHSNTRSAFGDPNWSPDATVSIRGNSDETRGLDVLIKSTTVSEARGVNSTVITAERLSYGVYADGQNAAENYGVYGTGNEGEINFGVNGFASSSRPSRNFGVFGYATSSDPGSFNAGGYFIGGLYTDAITVFSDQRVKTNVQPEGDITSRIMQLKPVNYNLVQGEKGFNFSKALQHGFIAQDMEKVFPELVTNVQHPVKDGGKTTYRDVKGINYIGLVSVLTRGMQEQSALVAAQEQRINTLEKEIKSLQQSLEAVAANAKAAPAGVTLTTGYELKQNVPNPFSANTIIYYTVPDSDNNASIAIFDLNGRMITQFANLKGKNQLTIQARQLQPGMYLYSLISAGQEILTKRMVVTK